MELSEIWMITFGVLSVYATTSVTGSSTRTECSCVCRNTSIQATSKIFEETTVRLGITKLNEETTTNNEQTSVQTTGSAQLNEESCPTVCNEITRGLRQNNPVGFATLGSAANVTIGNNTVEVYCDCSSGNNETWTVFQRRMDGSVEFYRQWTEYVNGFGNISGEFWLGLDWMNQFTKTRNYKLRIDLADFEGNSTYAEYSSFSIGNSSTHYTLYVDGYSGDAADGLLAVMPVNHIHNQMPFSTYDRENHNADYNCAESWDGAWWFNSCFTTHLNGRYYAEGTSPINLGIIWSKWRGFGYSLRAAEMKFQKIEPAG